MVKVGEYQKGAFDWRLFCFRAKEARFCYECNLSPAPKRPYLSGPVGRETGGIVKPGEIFLCAFLAGLLQFLLLLVSQSEIGS
jgi:hypothetical protein